MKNRKIIYFSIILVVLIGGGYWGWRRFQKEAGTVIAAPEERVVKLFKVSGPGPDSGIVYPGRIQPVRHAALFFRVSGPVLEQNLKLGQEVMTGEVLARIDPRDYQHELDIITDELEKEQVQNAYYKEELERQRKMFASNAASKAAFDEANTKKLISDVRINALTTGRQVAQDRLNDTVLKAPYDCAITEIKIEEHEFAQANTPAVIVQSLKQLEIRADIPEGNIPEISLWDGKKYKGQKFKLTFPGRGNREFQAVFEEFIPSASASGNTYEVRLTFDQPDDFIVLPGMTAEIHGLPHPERNKKSTMAIPYSAVINRNNQSCVWLYDRASSRAGLTTVEVGTPDGGGFVPVLHGDLKPGDLIVAAGGDWIEADTVLKVLNPEVLNENN